MTITITIIITIIITIKSASLRLPSSTTKEEIHEIVEKTLTELGISDCADVLIGGELIKGISGGQRKRTSVGVEIVTKPALLFLDEPTRYHYHNYFIIITLIIIIIIIIIIKWS